MMKKIFIVLAVMLVVGIACKKTIDPGGGACACSPTEEPSYLSLSIKGDNGSDLLNAANVGAFSKDQIQLYYKDNQGVSQSIEFTIRQSFSRGTTVYAFNQLFSTQITSLAKNINHTFFLKLGDRQPLALNLKMNGNKTEQLLINQVAVPLETMVPNDDFYIKSIFSLKL
ncbi:hypothetical protein [Pedobacter sp. GR22-10]|uniref:hypothetical protein n=1 Tax=Pedobacter sp. GR22-10 TaxID=2994472 RepID=UPI0022457EAC|nr:hypothetical protein [Pedobacter sp. GR22-10]MCX2432624.1 hypothetical protein [Pedobacter sp. GR22-10]